MQVLNTVLYFSYKEKLSNNLEILEFAIISLILITSMRMILGCNVLF